jgi:hypothetical protein
LEQQSLSKKVRTTTARESCASCERIQRRAPSARCSSISVGGAGRGQAEAAGPATKSRAGGIGSAPGLSCLAAQRFCRSLPRSRKRFATAVSGKTAVNAMACSHSGRGMGAKRYVRCWCHCVNWSAKAISWCSACAEVMLDIVASQSWG